MLGKLDRYVQKNETRPPSYITHKNKLKMESFEMVPFFPPPVGNRKGFFCWGNLVKLVEVIFTVWWGFLSGRKKLFSTLLSSLAGLIIKSAWDRVTREKKTNLITCMHMGLPHTREIQGQKGKMRYIWHSEPVSYTHLTLPTSNTLCRSRWSPYH